MTLDEEKREARLTGESTLRAYLELLRLPNVFTAIADVTVGVLFVKTINTSEDWWMLGMLVVASSMLYAAGVVINDVFDIEYDRHHRPERPLPSGRVSLKAARWLGWQLLTIGVLVACAASFFSGNFRPAMVGSLLALSIVVYNALAKPTVAGPLVMGGCRTLNVLLGMSVATTALAVDNWFVAGGVGLYVAGLTLFARNEAKQSRRIQLMAGMGIMLLGIATLAQFPNYSEQLIPLLKQQPQRWTLLMTILGILIGWRCFRAVLDPHPVRIRTAVTLGIFSLVLLDAAVCYAIRGEFWAIIILLLLVPAAFFGRWIAAT